MSIPIPDGAPEPFRAVVAAMLASAERNAAPGGDHAVYPKLESGGRWFAIDNFESTGVAALILDDSKWLVRAPYADSDRCVTFEEALALAGAFFDGARGCRG